MAILSTNGNYYYSSSITMLYNWPLPAVVVGAVVVDVGAGFEVVVDVGGAKKMLY